MIKYERDGIFCILLYTAVVTYVFMQSILPPFEIQCMKDGAIELSFTSASRRDDVYDMFSKRYC